jgi:hypothetical protein
VLQRDVARLAEVGALLLLEGAVVTTLLVRNLDEIVTEITTDETEVIVTALAVQMTG